MISGSEVAFFSLSPSDIQELEEEKSDKSNQLLDLKRRPKKLLATILISNNFINIAIVIISDYLVKKILPEASINKISASLQAFIPLEISSITSAISFLLTIVGVTFLLVLFGEVAPKIYANIHNVQFAKSMTGPMNFLNKILSPLSGLLVKWTSKMEGTLPEKTGNNLNKEELDRAIALTVDDNIDKKEADILRGIIKFGNVTAKQIMKSRMDVISIDMDTDYKSLMKLVMDCGYSRIPVIKDDFDNVEGLLYVKDLLGHTDENEHFEWQKLIRKNILYVPESKKIDDLLKEFQRRRLHMAIVVDEFGGSGGLVTLEDVMEEIIGEIVDEFDEEVEIEYRKIDENTYIFEGKSMLNDVCRIIGVDTETFEEVKGQSDSLAGLVLELLGHLPKKGREINYNEFVFRIIAVTKLRIEKIKVTIDR